MNDKHTYEIKISYKFSYGIGKISTTDSLLGRPLENFIDTGSPIEKLVYLLYQEKKNQSYYFLGTFILTKKRLLFFPAINFSRVILSDKNVLNESHLNHLTLENNLIDWHITVYEKRQDPKKKLNTYRTKQIENNISLWFVMCLSSHTHLVKLPKELEIKLVCQTSRDLRHRLKTIKEATVNCEMPVANVPSSPNKKYFLNFEFFLTANRNILEEEYFLPPGIFTVTNDIIKIENTGTKIFSRSTPVKIKGFNSLLTVRTSKITGRLNFPSLFISGHKYAYNEK